MAEEVAEATMALNLAAAALRRLQRLLLDEPESAESPKTVLRSPQGPVPASEIWKQPVPNRPRPQEQPETVESLRAAVERAMGQPGESPITFGSGDGDDDEEPAP